MNHNLAIQPPNLPQEYRYTYGPKISPTHTTLAGLTLAQLTNAMPPLQELNGTHYVVLDPPANGNSDKNKAVIMDFTVRNSMGPNWMARMLYQQGVIRNLTGEDVRIIGFPSTTTRLARGVRFWKHQTDMNGFNSREVDKIAHNDLSPYADRQAAVIEKHKINKVSGIAMSWGATVLGALAKLIAERGSAEITDLAFFDPATLHNGKTQNKMRLGFIKTLPNFHDAVLGTNVPAFIEAQNARYTGLHRQVGGSIAGTIGDLFLPEVRAQNKAMAMGGFIPAMHELSDALHDPTNPNKKIPAVLVTGERSGITEFDKQAQLELSELLHLDFTFLSDLPFEHALTNDMARVSIIGALNYDRGRQLPQNDSRPIPPPVLSTRDILLQRARHLENKSSS